MSTATLSIFIVAYVALQMGIGIWFARRTRTEADYFLAGRRLGVAPLTLSIFATWFGAETVLGASAAIAEGGLSGARAEPFGYTLSLIAMSLFIAGAIRSRGYVTLADFFGDRFGRTAELAAAMITIVISVLWAGAQLLAVAAILKTALGVPPSMTLFAAAGVVIFYCWHAGLIGDVATDVIQSLVLMIGVFVLLGSVIMRFGGVGSMLDVITPGQLRLFAEGESWLARMDAWSIPILGSVVTQEVITRFLAAKDDRTARTACLCAAGLYLVVGGAPVIIGLAAVHLGIAGAVGDDFIPAIALALLGPALAVVFTGALFSAILSTVDSNVLSVASLISINILKRDHQKADEHRRLRTARLATVGAGAGALVVALAGSDIYELIAMTSVFGQAGMLVATMFGLWSRFGGARAALAAIVVCIGVNLVTLLALPLADALRLGLAPLAAIGAVFAGDIAPVAGYFLLSVVTALLAYVCVGALEARRASSAASL